MLILKILMFILMFACIVLIHEWGHYITAKKAGVLVHEFAIGMGPILWSIQKGETKYSIRLLPIGGFCSMEEEVGEETHNPRAMANKKPWQKLMIVLAGAFMNFILAILLFSIYIGYTGYGTNQVAKLEPDMPAKAAGIEEGDQITAINGVKVETLEDFSKEISNEVKSYTFTIKRKGENPLTISITPKKITETAEDGSSRQRVVFGFTTKTRHYGIIESLKKGFLMTCMVVKLIIVMLGQLITGKVPFNQLSGIVGVVSEGSKIWDIGVQAGGIQLAIMYFINIAAMLSANLCVFNLLPIPALDGGRAVFIIIEMLRGKPVSPEKEGAVHFTGMVFLMLLTVVLMFADVLKLRG